MIRLFDTNTFEKCKSSDKLPLQCKYCGNNFLVEKRIIKYELKKNRNRLQFCTSKCKYFEREARSIQSLNCAECNKLFNKSLSEIKKSKSGNHFCSRSCANSFNNKNKTHGTRRSKLEIWLENQLNELYPNNDFLFNDKETIGSELDIYIPSLNVAFELNGIFHYEPIYGNDKLQQIQENDKSKSKACYDAKIDLCIIDTSSQKYFKPKTSQKYLDIITTIINQRTILNS